VRAVAAPVARAPCQSGRVARDSRADQHDRQLILKRMEAMFQPELATLSEADSKKTLMALEAVTDFESWARMIELFGCLRRRRGRCGSRPSTRLLPASPVS